MAKRKAAYRVVEDRAAGWFDIIGPTGSMSPRLFRTDGDARNVAEDLNAAHALAVKLERKRARQRARTRKAGK